MRRSVGWSAAFAAAFLALYVLALLTPWGQTVDGHSLGQPHRAVVAFSALRLACPVIAGAAAAVVAVTALLRGRWREMLACLLGAAVVILASGWIRDDVLHRPLFDSATYDNSFPSRHVVVTCAIALIAVRLWPWPAGRRVVAALAVVAVTIDSLASVATYAHRASDTMGAVLLVGVVVPVYAWGRLPAVRQAVLRRPPTLVVVCAVWLCVLALTAVATGIVATIGYLVLIALGTGGLTLIVARLVSATR